MLWKLKGSDHQVQTVSMVDFDGKVFEKELVKIRGVKYMAKTFTLPDVQVGTIVEYLYSVSFLKRIRPRFPLDSERGVVH